jgi:hypothetical protein
MNQDPDLSMANCYFAKSHGMPQCYIPFLYVIDFKRALSFGEAVPPAGCLEGYNDRLAYFSGNLLPVVPSIQGHLLLSDAGGLAALLASAVSARNHQ